MHGNMVQRTNYREGQKELNKIILSCKETYTHLHCCTKKRKENDPDELHWEYRKENFTPLYSCFFRRARKGLELFGILSFLPTVVFFFHKFVFYLSILDKRPLLIVKEGKRKELNVSTASHINHAWLFDHGNRTGSLAFYKATILCRSNTLVPFSAHHFSACSSV